MKTAEPLLKVEQLKKYFVSRKQFLGSSAKVVKAVDGISFEISKGGTPRGTLPWASRGGCPV